MSELEFLLRDIQRKLEKTKWFPERSEIIDLLITAIHDERSQSTGERK